jgi:Flp pilus assembly protein TadD
MTPEQRLEIGMTHHRAGQLREAEMIYRQILTEQPNHAGALHMLGSLAADVGQFDAAIELMTKAIQLNPNIAQYHANLGAIYAKSNRFNEAIAALQRATQLDPAMAAALYNLGGVFLAMFEFARAIPVLERAISLNPNWPELHNNLGVALRNIGEHQLALEVFKRSITVQPDFAEGHWNVGLTLLTLGDLADGWKEYEWGRKSPRVNIPRQFAQPRWKGEDLTGKTILLYAELGSGDTIHLIRYAPLVARRGGKVIVECQPGLEKLLRSVDGIQEVVAQGQPLPPFDMQCPMMSLPLEFGTTLETIPANVPYLSPPPDRVAAWRERIGDHSNHLNVGLVWAGRPDHKNDRQRSIRLDQFAPLATVKSVRFYSLQKGQAAASQAAVPPPGMDFIDWTSDLLDFAETAALMANLDLLISVDTSVIHMAGAIGKPVWVLIPFVPDFRWFLNRTDTPWYPTMRLFRQPALRDWNSVIADVTSALAQRCK